MRTFEKIRFRVLLGLLTCIALLPTGVLLVLSRGIRFVVGDMLHYRRRVVLDNLRRAFPEKDEREIRRIARGFYQHLSDLVVETVKQLHISEEELSRRVEFSGGDKVEEMAADGKPVILFLSHYGNWEWAQRMTCHYKRPSLTATVYRPVRNLVVDELMKRLRARFEIVLLSQKRTVRHLLQMDREGTQFVAVFAADQRPNSKNLYHWTPFLNQDTAYAVGGEEIGRRLNAHYVYLDTEKVARGHYRMTFRPITPVDDGEDYPYTRAYMRMLEQTIRRAPEYWLWSHNRWKFDRAGNVIHR